MGKRVVFGGLLVILAACGGHIDTDSAGESVPVPQRDDQPGLYQPAAPKGPERVAVGLGSPTAITMTEDRVLVTTRTSTIAGEHVAAGSLYVADKRVGPAYVLTIDRRGASFDALTNDGKTAFIATSDARILSIPVSGGTPITVATLDAPASTIATSGNHVYVATNAGALARVAKAGGEIEHLATITGAIRGLEADDKAVYVATGAAEETPAGIVRVPLDGSAVTVLAAGAEPCAMIRDGRRLFWTSIASGSEDGTKAGKGEVKRLSLEGGEPATVASGAFSACAIAADKDSLYFATTIAGALPVKNGGSGSAVGMSGLGLMRAPIAGGEPVAIAAAAHALPQPGAVAVDSRHVYWLTETSVLRLAK